MTIATVRPDGWPQATIVGYANDGLLIYFLISRRSQKFANIEKDARVALSIGSEADKLEQTKAVYAGAKASEVTDEAQRERAWESLMHRHPNLADFLLPSRDDAAMMRADLHFVSVLDFSKGIGHAEASALGTTETSQAGPA
jgi:nitroimidazol reductase NimA-like FMN-containing flavoprotein (pyridoxamine 5'-phosphate oxidase superfamily)